MRIEHIDRPEPGGITPTPTTSLSRRVAQDIRSTTQPPLHPFLSPPWTPERRPWSSSPSPGSPANHHHRLKPRTFRAQF
jgi:hypothetical protein